MSVNEYFRLMFGITYDCLIELQISISIFVFPNKTRLFTIYAKEQKYYFSVSESF